MKRAKQATTIIALLLLCTIFLSCMGGCTNEYSENLNKIFETEYFRCISYDNIHVTILALTEKGQRQTDSLIIPKEINGMEVNSLGGEIKGNSGYGIVNRERYRFYPRAHKIFFEGNCVLDDVKIDEDSARVELNLQNVSSVTDLIASRAKEFTVRLPANCPKAKLEKLKSYLDMTRGTTVVFLEVPSKAEPTQLHRIRTNKRILLHRALLEFVENHLENAWSFK